MTKRYLILYAALIIAIVSVGFTLMIKLGVKPEPVVIMKPSYFKSPSEIGAVVFRHFYAAIEDKRFVVFGLPPQPKFHQEILHGFIQAAIDEKRPFDIVLMESEMPDLDFSAFPSLAVQKVVTNTEDQTELLSQIQNLRKNGKRVLLYTASVLSSHLLLGNPINRIEKELGGENLFSISSGPLAVRAEQEFEIDPPCVGTERDTSGTSNLGCAILFASRYYYRANAKGARSFAEKNHEDLYKSRYVSIMQQNGAGYDFLLMTASPKSIAEATPGNNQSFRMHPPGTTRARNAPAEFNSDGSIVK